MGIDPFSVDVNLRLTKLVMKVGLAAPLLGTVDATMFCLFDGIVIVLDKRVWCS